MERISELVQTSMDIFTTKEAAYYLGLTEDELRYYTKVFDPILRVRRVTRTMRIYTKGDIYRLFDMISYAERNELSVKDALQYFIDNPIIDSIRPVSEPDNKLERQLQILIDLISNNQASDVAVTREENHSVEKSVNRTGIKRIFRKK